MRALLLLFLSQIPWREAAGHGVSRTDRSMPKCQHWTLKIPGSLIRTVFSGVNKAWDKCAADGGKRWRLNLYKSIPSAWILAHLPWWTSSCDLVAQNPHIARGGSEELRGHLELSKRWTLRRISQRHVPLSLSLRDHLHPEIQLGLLIRAHNVRDECWDCCYLIKYCSIHPMD